MLGFLIFYRYSPDYLSLPPLDSSSEPATLYHQWLEPECRRWRICDVLSVKEQRAPGSLGAADRGRSEVGSTCRGGGRSWAAKGISGGASCSKRNRLHGRLRGFGGFQMVNAKLVQFGSIGQGHVPAEPSGRAEARGKGASWYRWDGRVGCVSGWMAGLGAATE
jgi:hypothetical protein